jgi:hypothetical protein
MGEEITRRCYNITQYSPGWGRPTPTLVPWRQGFRLQQGTSVGAGLPKPYSPCDVLAYHTDFFSMRGYEIERWQACTLIRGSRREEIIACELTSQSSNIQALK